MDPTRREFLGRATTGAALLSGLPLALVASGCAAPAGEAQPTGGDWDLTWVNRIVGRHKAVYDVPEIESGYGVWRASIWANQYVEVLGAAPADITTVLILRHNGIVLAMQQAFWDRYGIGAAKNVTHPVTLGATDRNPALLASSRNELPADFDALALDKFMERGGIALACFLALQDCVERIRTTDNVTVEQATEQARAFLVPGVILQPSGVFAAVRAQEAGCTYVRAS